jgi:acylphosphatase
MDYPIMDRLHAFFQGKVQGVWFRANCQTKAKELGLTGWVKNHQNGDVELMIEGERKLIEDHFYWCQNNQPFAKVKNVELEWLDGTGEYEAFSIIR